MSIETVKKRERACESEKKKREYVSVHGIYIVEYRNYGNFLLCPGLY